MGDLMPNIKVCQERLQFFVGLVFLNVPTVITAQQDEKPSAFERARLLQGGGVILYRRYAATDLQQADANVSDLTRPEGAALVFRRLGLDGFEQSGRITPSDWPGLIKHSMSEYAEGGAH